MIKLLFVETGENASAKDQINPLHCRFKLMFLQAHLSWISVSTDRNRLSKLSAKSTLSGWNQNNILRVPEERILVFMLALFGTVPTKIWIREKGQTDMIVKYLYY